MEVSVADRMLYTLETAGELLGGLSRATMYRLVAAGELEAVKLNRLTRITASSLKDYIERLPSYFGDASDDPAE
jgi:excisionase family DNA binding protein